jgi:hypothetical protein
MNTKTFSVIVSAPDRTPEAVKERLDGTGLKVERIDTPSVCWDEIQISRSLADTLTRLLSAKNLYIEQPGIEFLLHKRRLTEPAFDTAETAWRLHIGGSRLTLQPYISVNGKVYPWETMIDIGNRTFVRLVNSTVYYVYIRVIENPEEKESEKFYHFYEGNRYVGSVFGAAQAQVLLEERKSAWSEFHDNFWSDGGDIEKSLHPLAPSRNDSGEMDRWLKRYSDWKG